jgi:hypothetical protein
VGQGLEIAADVARGQAMGAQAGDGQVRCAEKKAVGLPKKSSRSETRSGFGSITSACERQRWCATARGLRCVVTEHVKHLEGRLWKVPVHGLETSP